MISLGNLLTMSIENKEWIEDFLSNYLFKYYWKSYLIIHTVAMNDKNPLSNYNIIK